MREPPRDVRVPDERGRAREHGLSLLTPYGVMVAR
jgi:hypothetical protein